MFKKIIIAFLIPAFLLQVVGCYSEQWISKENLNTEHGNIRVVTNDKKEYNLTESFWLAKDDTLVTYKNKPIKRFFPAQHDTLVIYNGQLIKQDEIPYNSIDTIYIKKIDGGKTAIAIALTTLLGGALIYGMIKLGQELRPFRIEISGRK